MEKEIVGFKGYFVTTEGEVFSAYTRKSGMKRTQIIDYNVRKLLKQGFTKGYRKIILRNGELKKTFLVHRLVAEAFILKTDKNLQVNHKNGIKDDNRIENLEWITAQKNMEHAVKVLNRKLGSSPWLGKVGKENPHSKPVIGFTESGSFYQEFESISQVLNKLKELGIDLKINSTHHISCCCLGKYGRNSLGKYNWEPVKWKYNV